MNLSIFCASLKYIDSRCYTKLISLGKFMYYEIMSRNYTDAIIKKAIDRYDYTAYEYLIQFVEDKDILSNFLIDHTCIQNDRTIELLKITIDAGADVHFKDNEALKCACKQGLTRIVSLLLENGADVHANNDEPIMIASSNGNVNVMKKLLQYGANIHANNDCIMEVACLNHKNPQYIWKKVVALLLKHEAVVNIDKLRAVRRSEEYIRTVKTLKPNIKTK